MENIDMVAKQVSDSVTMVESMLDDFESKISLPLPTGTSVHVRDIFKGNLLDFMMHMLSVKYYSVELQKTKEPINL